MIEKIAKTDNPEFKEGTLFEWLKSGEDDYGNDIYLVLKKDERVKLLYISGYLRFCGNVYEVDLTNLITNFETGLIVILSE